MKKIGILTFHRADNYGAVLQTYALQKVLEQKNNQVQVIDYRCDVIEQQYGCLQFPRLGRNIYAWIKRVLFWIYAKDKIEKKTMRYAEFRQNYLKLTKPMNQSSDREYLKKIFDIIITGSDQIWNPNITNGVDKWYFFDKNQESVSVVSYAASMGNIEGFKKWFDEAKDILYSYDCISVREKAGLDFLKEKMPNTDLWLSVDPTLLVDASVWYDLTTEIRPVEEKYLLYYDAAQNETAKNIALQIADRKQLKLVHFNESLYRKNNAIYALDSGPIDFLNYFRHAECVITSSFHGTVFSLIFSKPFISVAHPNLGGRIEDLLVQLELEKQVYYSVPVKNEELFSSIDYEVVNERLKNLRKESMDYIDTICNLDK